MEKRGQWEGEFEDAAPQGKQQKDLVNLFLLFL